MPINNITQTISTIPEAGHRGIDVQTVFVNKQEDFQDHLQGTTVTELNNLKTQMNTMSGEMNTTASQVNTNANTATTKANEASASATSASTSASTATTKASQASASASTASTQAGIATTKASEASASATTATTKASQASASATSASTSASTATTKANEASASADSASQSLDSIEGILATLPDGSINDTLIGLDKAFSNQSLVGAFGRLSSPLLDLPLQNSLTMKAGVGSTTFTRASTATYIDRYGVLKTAGVDEPRFEREGYLNEGSSTNLVTNSSVFTHPEWGVATNTLIGGHPSPDGANNATLSTTINTDSCAIYKSVVFSGNTATISIFAKAGTSSSLSLRFVNYDTNLVCQFNLADKTVSHENGKIIELSNGWFRCSLSITFTGADLDGLVYCYTATNAGTNYISNIGNSMYVYGFQVEALPFATSYIPTTSSQVTRSADVLQVTRENNFPNAENNPEGYSVAFTYDSLGFRPASQCLWSLRIDAQNYVEGYLATLSNSLRSYIAKDGVGVSNSAIPVNPLGSNKIVQIQSNTLLKQYINGTLADTDVNTLGTLGGNVNSLANITIGGASTSTNVNLFGHISDFKVYDRELTPVEVSLL